MVPVLVGLGVLSFWLPAFAAGVYIDASGDVLFLTAPRAYALAGRVARSNGTESDASLYILDAAFPVRSWGLVELDIPFISIVEPSTVETGLGDLSIRARADLYVRDGRAFRLISALRTGTGTARVFPYSSQSIDLEVGIGYVDTLEMFHIRASGGGAYVSKEPTDVPEHQLHGHYGRFGLGLHLPFEFGFNVGVGLSAIFYEAGRSREIYLGTVEYRHSEWLVLVFAAHTEGGDSEERVGDTAVTGGLRIYY